MGIRKARLNTIRRRVKRLSYLSRHYDGEKGTRNTTTNQLRASYLFVSILHEVGHTPFSVRGSFCLADSLVYYNRDSTMMLQYHSRPRQITHYSTVELSSSSHSLLIVTSRHILGIVSIQARFRGPQFREKLPKSLLPSFFCVKTGQVIHDCYNEQEQRDPPL